MRLKSFSVTNYRSITEAHKIDVTDITVLVGANNEGKSNIIRALSLAMALIQGLAREAKRSTFRRGLVSRIPDSEYFFDRDFPIHARSKRGALQTSFRLEFTLTQEEIDEFSKLTKVNLGGELKIEITIGRDSIPKFGVILPGRGGKSLKEKSAEVCDFISSKLQFNHIPAVRTQEDTIDIIQKLVVAQIRSLDEDDEYRHALEKMNQIRKNALDAISKSISDQMKIFVPSISDLQIQIGYESSYVSRNSIEVIVNDGQPTPLILKGDGVKSLVALALLRERYAGASASIVAIEEPESHLHSAAIHQIRDVIYNLAGGNQVIITTHNPIFVDRVNLKSNIIIKNGSASQAKSIREIRDTLGVQASENLSNTHIAIVVEGECDEIILRKMIYQHDKRFEKLFRDGVIGFHRLGGANKLGYHLLNLKNTVCEVVAVLDNDDAARKDIQSALDKSLISHKDYFLISCADHRDSEIEDAVALTCYAEAFKEKFDVDLKRTSFQSKKKWSDRMGDAFAQSAKMWSEASEKQAKIFVAQCVSKSEENVISDPCKEQISTFISRISDLCKLKAAKHEDNPVPA